MDNSNIQLSKLKKGNKILLETKECVFDIEILSPNLGVVNITGGKRFLNPTQVKIVGVFGRRKIDDEDTLLSVGEIEKSLGIEIQYNDKDNITSDFVTSPITSAKIYGEDWDFEMWDGKEKTEQLHKAIDEAKARLRVKTKTSKEEQEDNNEHPDV